MKRFLPFAFALVLPAALAAQDWPVLKKFEGNATDRVAMPVGGIGTGCISIGGNGQWKDVEIMNKPAVGYYGSGNPKNAPVFLIWTRDAQGKQQARALAGPIPSYEYKAANGSLAPNNGFPRFAKSVFETAYPLGMVTLTDESMPVRVRLKTFNPMIPADPEASGIPVAVIRYEVTNTTGAPLDVSVAGSFENCIGMDGSRLPAQFWDVQYPYGAKNNRNRFRQTASLAGIYMTSDSVDRDDMAWGTMALTTPLNAGGKISYRTGLSPKGWNDYLQDLWDDFADDGILTEKHFDDQPDAPRSALAVSAPLKAGETRTFTYFLTWDFPNRKDWFYRVTVGNYYATQYQDAWDVAEKTEPKLADLEKKTIDFVRLVVNSDFPAEAKEAALFNSSTLRSQTTFRTKDGRFFGWEGTMDHTGSCEGNCTHVWNYEQTTPFLYGSLARSMRETEYHFALDDSTGFMAFRVGLPLSKHQEWSTAAADGQMGTVMRVYREWQLSGDDTFLKDVWPGVKKALGFAWIPHGWDADQDGVMEGCQHNTMDIEYFGPNPECGFWYLGALKAAAAMAHHLKDAAFEKKCADLFRRGSAWIDANLFNGEYYYQQIRPIADASQIAPKLRAGAGATDLAHPDFQIGEGCLTDQLVGQNMAWVCGLGDLADSNHLRKALESVFKYNFDEHLGRHFNNMRAYVMGDEAGMVVTAYPDPSKRPAVPLSYAWEAWTGLEYTAAAGMLYLGMNEPAMKTISAVRDRYDGTRRNPFNEEECGNHYTRAMAGWSTLLALSGFHYSGVTGAFGITSKPGTYFWSNGYAWGSVTVSADKVGIAVHHGTLRLRSVTVGKKTMSLKKESVLAEGRSADFALK